MSSARHGPDPGIRSLRRKVDDGSLGLDVDDEKQQQTQSDRSKTPSTISYTLPPPRWSYLRLSLTPSTTPISTTQPLDLTTLRLHLLKALQSYLGDHGAAVPVDILHVSDREAYVRVPHEDGSAVAAALAAGGGSAGLIVRQSSDWCVRLLTDGGRGLFEL